MRKITKRLSAMFAATTAIGGLLSTAVESHAAADAGPPLYDLTIVEPPPSFADIHLQAVNNLGDTAGVVTRHYDPDYYVVIRRADGTFEFLSRPPGCAKADFVKVLRINRHGQLLVDTHLCGTPAMFWGPQSKWRAIVVPGVVGYTASGMNDHGDVVGSTPGKKGFVWKWDGDVELSHMDGGVEFADINDSREIASTITHVADPGVDFDRDGVTGALLGVGQDPIYTGDNQIQTLDDYKDPKHWEYHVRSTAVALNAGGSIALDSPKHFPGEGHTTPCVWTRGQPMRCASDSGFHSRAVGIDDAGNLITATQVKRPVSYVMLADGGVHTLGSVCDPPVGTLLTAYGVSGAGFVVGDVKYRNDRRSFIMTPKRQ